MRASITPLVNGALLFALSFWLGECRSANNDFFDSVSVDNSPWQPITNNRESQRPSSPKFPPVRYSNPNHPSPGPPQWHPGFNRHSTTEKFKDGDRVGPSNKPKFTPPLSVDGYKSYSPGPFFNPNKPDFFESQPPFNPFVDNFRPSQDSNKRIPVHAIKPVKESPAPVYKEPGEPPILGQKLKPTTPSSFDFPPELNTGPASFSIHPHNVYSESRKKVKHPSSTGSGTVYQNEKLNSLKTSGRFPPIENDHNSVKDTPFNETGVWKDQVHEVQIGHGNKHRGQSKFHQNGVSTREVSPGEAPSSETSTSKSQSQKPGHSQRLHQNRTVVTSTRSEVKDGTNSANELKPDFNKQTHVIYSNTAQLVEDGPPSSLSDNEEFHPKEFGTGNIIKQITSVRTREPTVKPSQVEPVRTNNAEHSKPKPQFAPTPYSENSTEKFQPQNELANTVPIVESVPNGSFDKAREPNSASEEANSSETKKKFPFRRPQLLSTTSTEKSTTHEPSRRPTLKNSLKTRVNLNQSSKFRTTTELPTTITPVFTTEPPVKVKNHKEDGSVQSNDIPLKPSIRPMSDFNLRRRPVNRTSQNEVNVPPTGWALASFKNFTASRSTRRPPTEAPAVGVTELPTKVKPFVAWSTRLQKMTTTESSVTDMTTLMDDSDVEMTTFVMDSVKNTHILSSAQSSLNNLKDLNSRNVSNNISSTNETVSSTKIFSAEEVNNIRNTETNSKKTIDEDGDHNDNVSIENNASSPDDDGMTEDVSDIENEGSTSESGFSTHDSEKGAQKEEKVEVNDDMSVKNSSSPLKSPPFSKMKNEVSSSNKDPEKDSDQDSKTDIGESAVKEHAGKPIEKPTIAPVNDEIEFVEATNNSNAHGLYDTNDLKTKPIETIYLTDVKPGVVGLTNSVGSTFQQGKGSEISTGTNSSSLDNFVNNTKNETHSTSLFNNVPLFSSTDSVPFSKNYQNNSSQYSNELNTENEFGILKGVSSQLDLSGGNKSHSDSTTDIFNKIKDFNDYPTETEGLFEVSFDSPVDKTSSSTEGNFTTNVQNVSVKVNHAPSTVSSVPNFSNEEIPDFEFSSYKPQLSTEFSENSSSSSSSVKPTTEDGVKVEEAVKTTTDSKVTTGFREADRPSTNKSTSTIPNTTVSIQFVSPETDTTVKSAEKTNTPAGENKATETSSKVFDLSSRSSTTESVPMTSWAGPINFKTSTRVPFNRVEYTTAKTSAVPTTTVSSTMKLSTSTKKHENIIPVVPDKSDETGGTDEDMYIETDIEQESTPTTSTKTIITTAKPPPSNMSSGVSETDLCPSTTFCPVPIHIQLHIGASQSEICKTQNKLKNSIIKLFRSGTARVHLPEQIKFINLNFKECMKGDSEKMTDVNFYLSDGIGDFEQSINEEFIELYNKMGLLDYHPKVESAELVMNKDNDSSNSVGSEMDHSKTRVIAAVVIICLALICLILVILLLMIIRKRQKRFNYGQRCVPVTLDDYSLDNISVYNSVRRKGDARASKRSYGNPAFDDPNGPTHRMNFAGLVKFTSDQNAIDEEFASIPVVAVKPDELPPSAETKNRYANVIPLPETRIHLINTKNGGSSDYINANYVKGPKREEKFYIACQAPLQSTIEDFWRMIWEQQSKVILMLTDFFENGVEKCANYLPPSEVIDCNRVFGDFQVTLKKRENREKYIISSLQLKNLETNSWREVTHLWYTSWPPLGVPNEESSIIAFLIEARVYMKNNTGPNIVHCSPGTGRTGTVIACDLCIRDFEVTRMVDVPKCVYMLRRCRAGAVQTKQQYAFIYKVLNLYAAKLTGGGLDSI